MSECEKIYQRRTKRNPRELQQMWDGKQLLLPSQDYVKWLEKIARKSLKQGS